MGQAALSTPVGCYVCLGHPGDVFLVKSTHIWGSILIYNSAPVTIYVLGE